MPDSSREQSPSFEPLAVARRSGGNESGGAIAVLTPATRGCECESKHQTRRLPVHGVALVQDAA
jgi:hypothetical protein